MDASHVRVSLKEFLLGVLPFLSLIVGLLYPLAGFILYAVFRKRTSLVTLRKYPLMGAIASLVLYTIEFIVHAALGA